MPGSKPGCHFRPREFSGLKCVEAAVVERRGAEGARFQVVRACLSLGTGSSSELAKSGNLAFVLTGLEACASRSGLWVAPTFSDEPDDGSTVMFVSVEVCRGDRYAWPWRNDLASTVARAFGY